MSPQMKGAEEAEEQKERAETLFGVQFLVPVPTNPGYALFTVPEVLKKICF